MRLHRFLSACGAGFLAIAFTAAAHADIDTEWVASLPVDAALTAGIAAMTVDAEGVTYVTGTGGSSSNTDVVTAAFASDGTLLWSETYNGAEDWHDQGRGIALAPGGVLYVTGNTPDAASFATVLLLAYDAATGALLDEIIYTSGPSTSEHGASVAVDGAGNVYVGGGTVGDGGDAMILKFDSAGEFQWSRIWDGPASAPFSQDTVIKLLLDPDGRPVALIHGVMASAHPDYVVLECDVADGSTVWEATWGVSGGDFATDMEIDGNGDIYVTGTGLSVTNAFSTIKLDGGDGDLLWQEYDGTYANAVALALDGDGGVYITGSEDPDGDFSNLNNNFLTVKRDAGTGAFEWSHAYGDNCVGCYDIAADVVADPAGNVFVAGYTNSDPYSIDAITFVLEGASGAEVERGIVSGDLVQKTAEPRFLRFDTDYNLLVGGDFYDADTGDVEIFVYKYASMADLAVSFIRGDCQPDQALNLGDVFFLLGYLFLEGDDPSCLASCDLDSDLGTGLIDVIYLLNYLFASGPTPGQPFPDCGPAPAPDLEACASHSACND